MFGRGVVVDLPRYPPPLRVRIYACCAPPPLAASSSRSGAATLYISALVPLALWRSEGHPLDREPPPPQKWVQVLGEGDALWYPSPPPSPKWPFISKRRETACRHLRECEGVTVFRTWDVRA